MSKSEAIKFCCIAAKYGVEIPVLAAILNEIGIPGREFRAVLDALKDGLEQPVVA